MVDIRCFEIRSSITGNVSEAQIVGKNENYIGGFGRPLALLEFSTCLLYTSIRWSSPPERGGGQDKAIEIYNKGLEVVRDHKRDAVDPLEPSWGEPELLMSLAWSNLNRTTPDLNAAEQYAETALKLVPYWHYVRDILLPQIRAAQALSLIHI